MAVGFPQFYTASMPSVAVMVRGPSPLQSPTYRNGGRAGSATDMDTLKALIAAARHPGEVTQAIASATFAPRAAAFTSLIQLVRPRLYKRVLSMRSLGPLADKLRAHAMQCGKSKEIDKALEIFQAMQLVAGIAPNT
jgi:pentatricopeptide repeat protein